MFRKMRDPQKSQAHGKNILQIFSVSSKIYYECKWE